MILSCGRTKEEYRAAMMPGGTMWFVTLVGELEDIARSCGIGFTNDCELLALDMAAMPAWWDFAALSQRERVFWMRAALREMDHWRVEQRVTEIIEAHQYGNHDLVRLLLSSFPEDIVLRDQLTSSEQQRWVDIAKKAARGKVDETFMDVERGRRVDLVCSDKARPITGVYFASADATSVKIGFATDIAARIRGLQTAQPHQLHLLLAIQGTRKHERELHSRFSGFRLQGEWFRFAPEIAAFVASEKAKKVTN